MAKVLVLLVLVTLTVASPTSVTQDFQEETLDYSLWWFSTTHHEKARTTGTKVVKVGEKNIGLKLVTKFESKEETAPLQVWVHSERQEKDRSQKDFDFKAHGKLIVKNFDERKQSHSIDWSHHFTHANHESPIINVLSRKELFNLEKGWYKRSDDVVNVTLIIDFE